jgi:hypothetical protein
MGEEMPAPLEIQVLNVAAATWTPVFVPFDCSSISVKNAHLGDALRMRTDAQIALTEDVLAPGREQAFAVPFHRYRFLAGTQPLWLQFTAGAGNAVIKFLA